MRECEDSIYTNVGVKQTWVIRMRIVKELGDECKA